VNNVNKGYLDINEEFTAALDLMENTRRHLFVTGRAGTGKSTLLEYFRQKTARKVVILAPTGVAALNVGGETIHSFFKFTPGVTPVQARKKKRGKMYKNIDTIVIDEVSMVRADLLDCVDAFLRRNGPMPDAPFGGIQMIFIGDLYQLPPVVTPAERDLFRINYRSPYFFDAHALEGIDLTLIELHTIYRQHDDEFIAVLEHIRNNNLTPVQLSALNRRVGAELIGGRTKYSVYLTTTNKMADAINTRYLSSLSGNLRMFAATVDGDINDRVFPTAAQLRLKKGAQVMLLNNDSAGRWVNGTLAKVLGIEYDEESEQYVVVVELETGEEEYVTPHRWDLFKYVYDEQARSVEPEPVGTFTQYPLKLAWAVTIHKSQGKTFDNAVIDFGSGTFAHGQAYVALSRCRTLEGIVLKRPFNQQDVVMDRRIVEYMEYLRHQTR
jgi:ATP-dependent DNA helicase PIF1